jgi:hypothetical protein
MIRKSWCQLPILAGALLIAGASVPTAFAQSGNGAAAALRPGAADTVRTNLWLVEALMREAVETAIGPLDGPPAGVLLVPERSQAAEELMTQVAMRELDARGYTVYMLPREEDETTTFESDADFELGFRVMEIDLEYPETGRRLGIWREWVAREVSLTVAATLTERASGRLLFSDRIVRSYQDRVPDDDLGAVETGPYGFTRSEVQESGWQGRLEQIVVLGTLAGLVAVYFANTQ